MKKTCFNYSVRTMPAFLPQLSLCLTAAFLLFGCASPTATLKKEYAADKYKVVYMHAPENAAEDDPRNIFPQVVSRLEKLGFTVISVNKDTTLAGSQGSGFIVDSKGYILTSRHIFENEIIATVWIKGKRYDARVIHSDKDKDIALLKIDNTENLTMRALPIKTSPAYKMGQEVYAIGFPLSDILGNSPRLSKGLISSTVGLKDNPDYLQVSVEIQAGNSGSPLLDDNGAVIGLLQGTLDPLNILARTGGTLPQNVNFALKTAIIKEFLNEAHEDVMVESDFSMKIDFEAASDSLAQVRAGNVTEDFLKQPKMICKVGYRSFWDLWYRFRVFHIEFYDLDTGELLLKAGQYGDNPFSTEAVVLDQTFAQIRDKFFPNSKNVP
jgi:S1-C subfamily serine protease